jgi:predicted phage terminase large subunit-like protein
MTGLTRAEFDMLTRACLYTFVQRVFLELNPTRTFHGGRHLEYICAEVAAMLTGDTRRLALNLPPRNLKSIIVSVAFVAWVLGRDPSKRFLLVSYGQDLPQSFARDILRVMRSAWYQHLFPGTRIHSDYSRIDDFRTTQNGRVKVESLQGGLTGFGADYIILDDPMKPLDAYTEHSRKKANETIQNTVLSRQDGLGAARVLLVMQRIHEEDPTGYLMARQLWRHIRLPAIAEEDEEYEFVDAFGARRAFRREAGEALNPAYEPIEVLLEQKQLVGDYVFAAQYQQRPAPMGGGIFKIDDFRREPRASFPQAFDKKVQSWDTGSKEGITNDYSVCVTIGVVGGLRYVLDVRRDKWAYDKLRLEALAQQEIHRPDVIIVEDKSIGEALIPDLRTAGIYNVVSALPTVSKVVRAEGQIAIIHGGGVIFPSDAPWLDDLLYEFALFPKGRHDDQVDSLCQALQWIRDNTATGWFAYMNQETARMKAQGTGERMVRMQAPPGVNTLQLSELPNYAHTRRSESSLKFGGSQLLRSDNGMFEVPEAYIGMLLGAGFRLID